MIKTQALARLTETSAAKDLKDLTVKLEDLLVGNVKLQKLNRNGKSVPAIRCSATQAVVNKYLKKLGFQNVEGSSNSWELGPLKVKTYTSRVTGNTIYIYES